MKKIFLALALLASFQFAGAQVKSQDAAAAAIAKAQADAQNPKKATKVATWMKLGQTLMDAYNAPAGNGMIGMQKAELKLMMGKVAPTAVENVVLGGQEYVKESYANSDYYYANDVLNMIVVTKPYVENALAQALEAYKQAGLVDAGGKKKADIAAAIEAICNKYVEEAYNAYTLGDLAKASVNFEKAAEASLVEPFAKLDTNSLYNAGFAAWQGGDNDKAIEVFNKCIGYGYYANDGEVFGKLAECTEKSLAAKAEAIADEAAKADAIKAAKAAAKDILEKGFQAYPASQSILIGLINYYVTSGEDTDRLFVLLDGAKKNEPNNASLYYVEGNIRSKLNQEAEAIEAYRKCAEINPAYEFGYIGEGILMYNKAIDVQTKAQEEFDDNKYMVLVKQFEEALKGCIAPFEKAFEISKDNDVKVSIAEYLKNACYRFRDEDASFAEKYEKFKAITENGTL